MTFDDFIAKQTGKHVDTDGVYPDQCMDLMHQYLIDCFGLTDSGILAQPSAYLVYTNFTKLKGNDKFERIANTPTGVPRKGDIIFWGQTVGQHGHVAVFVEGDANTFKSFDANWPSGSLPHIQSHNYNGVLGWLRPKVTNTPQPYMPTQISPEQLKHYQDMEKKGQEFEKLTQHNSDWKTAQNIFDFENFLRGEIKKKQDRLEVLEPQNRQLTEDNNKLKGDIEGFAENDAALRELLADCEANCQGGLLKQIFEGVQDIAKYIKNHA